MTETLRVRKLIWAFFLLTALLAPLGAESPSAGRAAGVAVDVEAQIFPQEYTLFFNGVELPTIRQYGQMNTIHLHRFPSTEEGILTIRAEGYRKKQYRYTPAAGEKLYEKLERIDSRLELVTEIETGASPKSVEFSDEGDFMTVALLGGPGGQTFAVDTWEKLADLNPSPADSEQKGFVESLHFADRGEVWISQMTTAKVHIFDDEEFAYQQSVDLEGIWSKVIGRSPDGKVAWVTNWLSYDVTEIDLATMKVTRRMKVNGVPRGLYATPDGKWLYVCIFDTGHVDVLDLQTGKIDHSILRQGWGAARHMTADEKTNRLYMSDMARGTIRVFQLPEEKILSTIYVATKLNTIELTPDGKYLFVSSRGENGNGPAGYLDKGPDLGRIFVIDTETMEIVDWVWGRNQPTGLDISPDGRYLAFTDFLDYNMEIYDIRGLYGYEHPVPRNWLE